MCKEILKESVNVTGEIPKPNNVGEMPILDNSLNPTSKVKNTTGNNNEGNSNK